MPTWTALDPRIRERVEHDALKFGVSTSFVVSTALADAMGIELEPALRCDYKEP